MMQLMELGEPLSSKNIDDVLMGTDAEFYGFMESLLPSAAPTSAAKVVICCQEQPFFSASQ